MLSSILVLLPPLLVLISACVWRKLNPALIVGIISGTFIASQFSIGDTLQLIGVRIFNQAKDPDYLYLYGFLLLIGCLIVLLSKTGGANGFANAISKHLRSKKAVETSSLLLSSLLFIDDYLSSLTVGYVIRPLSDSFKIPRVKLAFLVHSLSGPLVILVPISSWVAMITSQEYASGINLEAHARIFADPFFTYMQSIPFIFYSIILIASVWFIVLRKISFGPMREQELIASKTGNLFGAKSPCVEPMPLAHSQGELIDLLFPLSVLIACVFGGILYSGGFWLLGGTHTFWQALQTNTQTFFVLFCSSLITLGAAFIFGLFRKTLSPRDIQSICAGGFQLMKTAILMVFLASTFGTILKHDLRVGAYLASALIGILPLWLLPLMFFLVSAIIGTITGSSWGTIAIMAPVTIQMLSTLLHIPLHSNPADIALLLPVLGAVFSGAVCGDHISPISETTIMAATSSGAYPLDHAYTQIFYTIPVICATSLAFMSAGLLAQYGAMITSIGSLLIGLVSSFVILWYLNKK